MKSAKPGKRERVRVCECERRGRGKGLEALCKENKFRFFFQVNCVKLYKLSPSSKTTTSTNTLRAVTPLALPSHALPFPSPSPSPHTHLQNLTHKTFPFSIRVMEGKKKRLDEFTEQSPRIPKQPVVNPLDYFSTGTTMYRFSQRRRQSLVSLPVAVLLCLASSNEGVAAASSLLPPSWLAAKSKLSARLLMEHFRRRSTSKSAFPGPVQVISKLVAPEWGAKYHAN